jgi:hypothetical protein
VEGFGTITRYLYAIFLYILAHLIDLCNGLIIIFFKYKNYIKCLEFSSNTKSNTIRSGNKTKPKIVKLDPIGRSRNPKDIGSSWAAEPNVVGFWWQQDPTLRKKQFNPTKPQMKFFYHHPAFIQYKKKFSSIYLLFTLLYEKN